MLRLQGSTLRIWHSAEADKRNHHGSEWREKFVASPQWSVLESNQFLLFFRQTLNDRTSSLTVFTRFQAMCESLWRRYVSSDDSLAFGDLYDTFLHIFLKLFAKETPLLAHLSLTLQFYEISQDLRADNPFCFFCIYPFAFLFKICNRSEIVPNLGFHCSFSIKI